MNERLLLETLGGNREALRQILTEMSARLVSDIQILQKAERAMDAEAIKFAAHKMNFMARMLEAKNLVLSIRQLEDQFEQDRPAQVVELAPMVIEEARVALGWINEQLIE